MVLPDLMRSFANLPRIVLFSHMLACARCNWWTLGVVFQFSAHFGTTDVFVPIALKIKIAALADDHLRYDSLPSADAKHRMLRRSKRKRGDSAFDGVLDRTFFPFEKF